jgi:hypothetical protein
MKAFVFTFTVIFFLTAILFPVIEILGAFMDLVKMNVALLVSSRGAINRSLDQDHLRDVKIEIDYDVFLNSFKQNFSLMMGLDEDLQPKRMDGKGFNEFILEVNQKTFGESQNQFIRVGNNREPLDYLDIEISTEYRFKTSFMRTFSEQFKKPVVLRVNRIQNIRILN